MEQGNTLRELQAVLSRMPPREREDAMEILTEDPSLIEGFVDRANRKHRAATGNDPALIRVVLAEERALVSSFSDRLKADAVRLRLNAQDV